MNEQQMKYMYWQMQRQNAMRNYVYQMQRMAGYGENSPVPPPEPYKEATSVRNSPVVGELEYGNKIAVVGGESGIWYSNNCVNRFQQSELKEGIIVAVGYSPKLKMFAAVVTDGNFVSGPNKHYIATSTDGINWTRRYTDPYGQVGEYWAPLSDVRNIIYDEYHELFICGFGRNEEYYFDGDVKKVKYTPIIVSHDGITWNPKYMDGITSTGTICYAENIQNIGCVTKMKYDDKDGFALWQSGGNGYYGTDSNIAIFMEIQGLGDSAQFTFTTIAKAHSIIGYNGNSFELNDNTYRYTIDGSVSLYGIDIEQQKPREIYGENTIMSHVHIGNDIYMGVYDGKILKMDSAENITEEYSLTGEITGRPICGMLKYGDDKILLYIGASNVPVYCYDINTKECNPILL